MVDIRYVYENKSEGNSNCMRYLYCHTQELDGYKFFGMVIELSQYYYISTKILGDIIPTSLSELTDLEKERFIKIIYWEVKPLDSKYVVLSNMHVHANATFKNSEVVQLGNTKLELYV